MGINKAYININVILDLLLKREPTWTYVSQLFNYSKAGKITLFTSPISFDTIYYILRRSNMPDKSVRKKIKILLGYVEPTVINKEIIEEALDERYKNFEDGIHIRCAEQAGMDLIVTSNTKDFKMANIGVYTAKTLLKLIDNHD